MTDMTTLTIRHAQENQPWTVPYAEHIQDSPTPHVLATHCTLHATKTLGKLASVFEALDHTDEPISDEQREQVRGMAADLMTAALRFANLYKFDLAAALVERVEEKNGVEYPAWSTPSDYGQGEHSEIMDEICPGWRG